jgi:hypothetical protein
VRSTIILAQSLDIPVSSVTQQDPVLPPDEQEAA